MSLKAKASRPPLRDLETDVCVVGSGAGGAVMAKELAEGGLRVVVLEKGGRFTKRDFTQKEEEMFPRLYEDAGLRATQDQSVIILHAQGVGGTTLVNDNICFRTPDFVLEHWKARGIEHIAPPQMVPYFEKVEKTIGVCEIQAEEVSRNDQLFYRGAAKLGLQPKRFSHNRKDCIGCGFCYCGCAYDRKQNMALTYLPQAEVAGAMILDHTEAEEIGRNTNRVTHITASRKDPRTGCIKEKLRIRQKCLIIAGGGISTPILLLKNGFGRLNPNVGRHLSLHPILASLGVMAEEVRFYEGIPQCVYTDRIVASEMAGFVLEGIGAHPVLTSLVLNTFGEGHRERMRDFNRLTVHYVMVMDRPQGRIRVGPKGQISITYRFHPRDQQSLREGMKLSAQVYFAAGARKVYLNHVDAPVLEDKSQIEAIDRLRMEPNRILLYSAHQIASCRMGTDPKHSVTDSFGKFHGMENLFISDASLFPTSLGYNPQVTIMALATRNAEYILNSSVVSKTVGFGVT
ncbi:MAG: GMC family oxidoreductase [Candidatus Omnitrophica bacterium]|nr:GMC family oxidoreductase [Candidatus Omnitrophota bacterium]